MLTPLLPSIVHVYHIPYLTIPYHIIPYCVSYMYIMYTNLIQIATTCPVICTIAANTGVLTGVSSGMYV